MAKPGLPAVQQRPSAVQCCAVLCCAVLCCAALCWMEECPLSCPEADCRTCAGIALTPDTPAEAVFPVVEAGAVDTVLLLSVRPGGSAHRCGRLCGCMRGGQTAAVGLAWLTPFGLHARFQRASAIWRGGAARLLRLCPGLPGARRVWGAEVHAGGAAQGPGAAGALPQAQRAGSRPAIISPRPALPCPAPPTLSACGGPAPSAGRPAAAAACHALSPRPSSHKCGHQPGWGVRNCAP